MDTMYETKILVVEDEDPIAQLFKLQLELQGFLADIAHRWSEMMEHLKISHYDCMLMDVVLPDKNGILILKELKEMEKTKHIPVIMVSNVDDFDHIKEACNLGATDYFIKSRYDMDEIIKAIQQALVRN